MMGTWIWPLRPIMLEKAQSIAPMEFRHFAKPGTTYKKYRMPTFGQDRGVVMDCGLIHGPSTKTSNPPAASYSRTNNNQHPVVQRSPQHARTVQQAMPRY